MRSSAEHSPALTDAERVAAHPGSQDALLLAAVLVTHAPGGPPTEFVDLRKTAWAEPCDPRPMR